MQHAKWRQIVQDNNNQEVDSDDEADNYATKADVTESKWISDILANEPMDKVYIKREDSRVGGYRAGPPQVI